MLTGWLIVNHFITSKKFLELFEWLSKAAKQQGVKLIKKTNVEVMSVLNAKPCQALAKERPDFVLFWDKDIRLAKFLESNGLRLFNCAEAIETCDDKALMHIRLNGREIKMPETIIAPKTFNPNGYTDLQFLEEVVAILKLPLVVKECFGSFGQQVYLAQNNDELLKIVKNIGNRPMLFQTFVATSMGRDIRVNVVGKHAVAAMLRTAVNGDFRANATNGAHIEAYTPSPAQIDLALRACEALKLDFAGVDILFGEGEAPMLCEVNSNAHFKNMFDCTGVDVADCILRHIIEAMKFLEVRT